MSSWKIYTVTRKSILETTSACYCFSLFLPSMLKVHRRPERTCTLHRKKEECYFGDDLEAMLSAIKDNLLDENEEFTSELNADVEEVGVHPQSTSFSCDSCEKVCKTQRGLTRHRNSLNNNNAEGDAYKSCFEERLHGQLLLKFSKWFSNVES